jgi:hypothetical protein
MGLLFERFSPEPGERVVWSKAVNDIQGGGRRVGGRLFLTNYRFAFRPLRWERPMQGRGWTVDLVEVEYLRLAPAWRIPANARSLLCLTLKNGTQKLLGFNGKKRALRRISEATQIEVRTGFQSEDFGGEAYKALTLVDRLMPLLSLCFVAAFVLRPSDWLFALFAAVGIFLSVAFARVRVQRQKAERAVRR